MKKHFTIEIKRRHEVISIDRLKPAYLDTEFSLKGSTPIYPSPHTGSSNPITTTHSVRKVRWPSKPLDQPLILH